MITLDDNGRQERLQTRLSAILSPRNQKQPRPVSITVVTTDKYPSARNQANAQIDSQHSPSARLRRATGSF